jgi:short-subunit dehydrogenase
LIRAEIPDRMSVMKDLAGATALVTGASKGIGVHVARQLAREGMNVVLAARSESSLREVRDELAAKAETRIVAVPTDVSRQKDLIDLVARAEQELGAVDVLVNNAGTEHVGHFESIDPEHIARVVSVNLTGTMMLARLVLPGMIARGRGHIVNMASVAGLGGSGYNELYSATKHGIVGFTRALRASLLDAGHEVGASVICPGYVSDTGMFEDLCRTYGVKAPAALGLSAPEAVAKAVVAAIRGNLPDVVINPGPTRALMGTLVLFPRLVEKLARQLRFNEPLRRVAEARREAANLNRH